MEQQRTISSPIEQAPSLPPSAAGITSSVPPVAAPVSTRLFFIDNMRIVLVCMVVVQHLAETYGGLGSWYYHDPASDLFTSILLSIYTMIAPAFGMGLFFLIAGYFTVRSCDRKKPVPFLQDRLIRLGIPLLLYDLVVNPLVDYIAGGLQGSYWSFYGHYLLYLRAIGDGPVWFNVTLLCFTFFYVAWRWLTRNQPPSAEKHWERPSNRSIYLFIFALGLVSFVVRIWCPLGWWFQPLDQQVSYIPQYICLFCLGLIAYRRNWFLAISPRMAREWLRVGIIALLIVVLGIAIGGAIGASVNPFAGGFHWQALAEAVWEGFLVAGMSIGVPVLFRTHWNRQGRLAKALAANAYTVYLIHPLVLVSFAYAFHAVSLYPLLKFAIAVLVALPLCFLLSSLIRKLPLANKVL